VEGNARIPTCRHRPCFGVTDGQKQLPGRRGCTVFTLGVWPTFSWGTEGTSQQLCQQTCYREMTVSIANQHGESSLDGLCAVANTSRAIASRKLGLQVNAFSMACRTWLPADRMQVINKPVQQAHQVHQMLQLTQHQNRSLNLLPPQTWRFSRRFLVLDLVCCPQ